MKGKSYPIPKDADNNSRIDATNKIIMMLMTVVTMIRVMTTDRRVERVATPAEKRKNSATNTCISLWFLQL